MTSRRPVVAAILLSGMLTPVVPAMAQSYATPPLAANARHVTAFGAVCDGQRDDTAAIQAGLRAIVNGGQLVFPPDGVCVVRKSLNLGNARNWNIRGQNATIKMHGSVSGFGNNWVLSLFANRNFGIYDLTIDGNRQERPMPALNGPQGGAHNLAIWGGTDFKIVRTRLVNAAMDGVLIGTTTPRQPQPATASRRGVFHDIVANNNWRVGLVITNGENITIENSVFSNNTSDWPRAGIDIEADHSSYTPSSRSITIRNNVVTGNGGYGVQISKVGMPRTITVDRNYLSSNGRGAVAALGSDITVSNNMIENFNDAIVGNGWRDTKGMVDIGPGTYNKVMNNSFSNIGAGVALLWVPGFGTTPGHVFVGNCVHDVQIAELFDPRRRVTRVANQFSPSGCPNPTS